jgi:hypothetical protein
MFAIHKAGESDMKLKIAIATMAGCMALAACGGNNNTDNTINADENMTDLNAGMTDLNTTTDMNAGMTDMNTTTDMNATGNMDMNATDTTNTSNTSNTM